MRIGIDMAAVQSPGSQGRGIGRYARNLVGALLRGHPGHDFVLYTYDALPDGPPFAAAPNASARCLNVGGPPPLDRVARENPDRLDALLMISPFEQDPWYAPPARPPSGGVPLLAVLHDLIPFLFQERYLNDPDTALRSYRTLETLRRYDALLTNSEATRADALRVLRLPERRVVTIGGAAEAGAFRPAPPGPPSAADRAALLRLGVSRPFVFSLSGADPRKNPLGLVDAFALLPPDLRAAHQLVIACHLTDAERRTIRLHAESRGLTGETLALTGGVADDDLRVLYQRCAAFAFPSKYEGLGLPLLEAMHCGAAVVAGGNSSQVEVVGDAGLLVNAENPSEIAGGLAEILRDPARARALGARGLARSREFTWEKTARRAVEAVARVAARRPRARPPRPRVAVFSPWPPKASGVSDYALRLVHEWRGRYAVDLFHDGGYVPEVALGSADFACHDHRLFRRFAAAQNYHAVLYQMGNSRYHQFLYPHLLETPGVVTLHDHNLAAFHFENAHRPGAPAGAFASEVAYTYPGRAGAILPHLAEWTRERGGLPQAFPRRGLHLNRRVLEHAAAVVVHSPWCVAQVRRDDPDLADRLVVVPLGATPREVSAGARAATRARFRIPPGALALGSFGTLSQAKMNVEALEAFRPLAAERPDSLFVLAGDDCENGEARNAAEALGLSDRVRFLGRLHDDDFADLTAAVDLGVCLRRPPTYGETSAALLDLLRHGVATVVTDVDTFADYPDGVVRKVRWPADGVGGLARALADLARDPEARAALGRAAVRHVRDRHAWPDAAARYAEVLDRVAARRPCERPATPRSRSA